MVLEVSVADADAVGSFWQTHICESYCRSLGYWSKALPPSAYGLFSPLCSFEDTFLGLILLLSRDRILNCGLITMRPEPAHHELCCSVHEAIKLGVHILIEWKWYICDWA